MRWLNEYHRGYNRIVLVILCLAVIMMVLYVLLSNEYKTEKFMEHHDRSMFKDDTHWEKEHAIAMRVQQLYRANQKLESPTSGFLLGVFLLEKAKAMPEAVYFNDKHLETVVELAVLKENTYSIRAAAARGRVIRHSLIALAACVGVFVVAHGCFDIGVWIARGFRKTE